MDCKGKPARSLGWWSELCLQHPVPTEQRTMALYSHCEFSLQINICYPLFWALVGFLIMPTAMNTNEVLRRKGDLDADRGHVT